METLLQFLQAWYVLMHEQCTVLNVGYAGVSLSGGRSTVYGGSCAQAVLIAQQIGGQVLNLANQVIWPGP